MLAPILRQLFWPDYPTEASARGEASFCNFFCFVAAAVTEPLEAERWTEAILKGGFFLAAMYGIRHLSRVISRLVLVLYPLMALAQPKSEEISQWLPVAIGVLFLRNVKATFDQGRPPTDRQRFYETAMCFYFGLLLTGMLAAAAGLWRWNFTSLGRLL